MMYNSRHHSDYHRAVILAFLVCAFLLYMVRFADAGVVQPTSRLASDAYDARIGSIRSLEGLEQAARAYMPDTGNHTRDLSVGLTRVVALHTMHGISRQSWRENWIANVLDSLDLPYTSFAGRMRPADLAEDNIALCSQAALLLKELFRRNGIDYATVVFNVGGVPPHSAVAARPDGVWRYYDPSWEPSEQGVPFDRVVSPGTFSRIYAGKGVAPALEQLARDGRIAIEDVDGDGPTRGIAFQALTQFVSLYAWLLPLLIAFRLISKLPIEARRGAGHRRRWGTALSA